ISLPGAASEPTVVVDQTNYNVGTLVSARFEPESKGVLSIYYAGDPVPVARGISLSGKDYRPLWNIAAPARTGRYEIELRGASGKETRVASFAVHRQLAKVVAFDLDK